MLDQDNPTFANWDQDATAVEGRYSEQDAEKVALELEDAASVVSELPVRAARFVGPAPAVAATGPLQRGQLCPLPRP